MTKSAEKQVRNRYNETFFGVFFAWRIFLRGVLFALAYFSMAFFPNYVKNLKEAESFNFGEQNVEKTCAMFTGISERICDLARLI